MKISFQVRIWLIIILLTATESYSQNVEIDSIIKIIEFKQDSVRAVFDWVANEIEYDTQSLLLINESNIGLYNSPSKSIVQEVISRRKGVCQGYAELLNAILRRLGFQSFVIEGYTVQYETIETKYGHAWNAVKIDGYWFMYDPTWSAGSVNNFIFKKRYDESWYKVSPESFIQTHVPFDPIWQFINPPLSHYQIKDYDFTINSIRNFNFPDSIAAGLKHTKQEQAWASMQRIKKMGVTNSLIQRHVENLQTDFDLAQIHGSRDSLRLAINYYNKYIFSKNSRFRKPVLSDKMIRDILEEIKIKINVSNHLLNSVCTSNKRLAQYKSEIEKEILSLSESVSTETIFINKYLSIWSPLRSAFKF